MKNLNMARRKSTVSWALPVGMARALETLLVVVMTVLDGED
jgi:hypothetical protein